MHWSWLIVCLMQKEDMVARLLRQDRRRGGCTYPGDGRLSVDHVRLDRCEDAEWRAVRVHECPVWGDDGEESSRHVLLLTVIQCGMEQSRRDQAAGGSSVRRRYIHPWVPFYTSVRPGHITLSFALCYFKDTWYCTVQIPWACR